MGVFGGMITNENSRGRGKGREGTQFGFQVFSNVKILERWKCEGILRLKQYGDY